MLSEAFQVEREESLPCSTPPTVSPLERRTEGKGAQSLPGSASGLPATGASTGHAREEASTRQRGSKHLCRWSRVRRFTNKLSRPVWAWNATFCTFRWKWDVQAWKPAWSLPWSVTNPAWHSFLIAEASINGPFLIAVLNYRMVHNMFMFLFGVGINAPW